jgi:glutamyl-Q tRNA(Asp) synthetase
VLDDALQGITHVIRGQDLFEAAHIQRLLQALLDLPTPTYRHHRLLLGPDGKRYAKRDKAQTLRELRAAGMTPEQLRAEIGLPCRSGRPWVGTGTHGKASADCPRP